ncbi:MAG: Imidazolonepropionase [Candidatus Heimdallarchaeota archaeon LC_2]|nr:MAG: Imidazolonepropionase [Candidatus Heimdallarchaeota archaeon LC_2]
MSSERLIITNTNMLDIHSLKFKPNQTIVMENNKFTWIGDEGSFEKQESDTVNNGEGKYVIPGMMDLHVHLSYTHKVILDMNNTMMRHKDAYWEYWALKNSQQYLNYGFTTLRGCGSHKGLSSLREIIDEGVIPGPRLKLALEGIGQPGNQEAFGPQHFLDANKELETTSGKDGVIHAVRDRKSKGSDHIKTATTGGVVHGKGSDVNLSLWRDEELEAMVSEAERLGIYVAAHAHADVGISAAVRTGVRSIEHCSMPTEETLDNMVKMKTYLVATQSAVNFINFAPEKVKAMLPPEIISKWKRVSQDANENHKLAFQKGIPIALGTDAPVAGDHCHSPLELKLLVQNVGMTPLQAIEAGTKTAARVIQMEDQLGSIEVGKLADLVLLEKSPEADITIFEDLNNLFKVIKDGKIVSEKGKLKHYY